MSAPTRPRVECEQHHANLSVRDVRAAADFYTKKLRFTLALTEGDPPMFAGVSLATCRSFLRNGTPSPEECSVYFVGGNADELYQFHRANGVDVVEAPQGRPYKLRDCTVRDPSGYYLNFGHRPSSNAAPAKE